MFILSSIKIFTSPNHFYIMMQIHHIFCLRWFFPRTVVDCCPGFGCSHLQEIGKAGLRKKTVVYDQRCYSEISRHDSGRLIPRWSGGRNSPAAWWNSDFSLKKKTKIMQLQVILYHSSVLIMFLHAPSSNVKLFCKLEWDLHQHSNFQLANRREDKDYKFSSSVKQGLARFIKKTINSKGKDKDNDKGNLKMATP